MNERHTVEEIMSMYPDKYVIITDLETTERNVVLSGIVRYVGDEEDYVDVIVKYNKTNIEYIVMHTFSDNTYNGIL